MENRVNTTMSIFIKVTILMLDTLYDIIINKRDLIKDIQLLMHMIRYNQFRNE